MLGFLVQWPTIPTLVMFPVLALAYRRLSSREEREVKAHFGGLWDTYAARAPRFIPARRRSGSVVPADQAHGSAKVGARPQRP
jgi:protein-S-isoprenylcysteine O-methyltransferase Ste14